MRLDMFWCKSYCYSSSWPVLWSARRSWGRSWRRSASGGRGSWAASSSPGRRRSWKLKSTMRGWRLFRRKRGQTLTASPRCSPVPLTSLQPWSDGLTSKMTSWCQGSLPKPWQKDSNRWTYWDDEHIDDDVRHVVVHPGEGSWVWRSKGGEACSRPNSHCLGERWWSWWACYWR